MKVTFRYARRSIAIATASILFFIYWLQPIGFLKSNGNRKIELSPLHITNENDASNNRKLVPSIYDDSQKKIKQQQQNFEEFIDFNDMNTKQMREFVRHKNSQPTIANSHLLAMSDNLSNYQLIIIVQSHKRHEYLAQLMNSLKKARDIKRVLLIVSHDYLMKEMIDVVHKVDFCHVLQIYFPYAMQLYPDQYPGTDPQDCSRDTPKEVAILKECKNAKYPDRFGHYREAKFTMTKHHWWWKVNFVFDQLKVTKRYQGLVLFLEEDHYVAPDFLTVIKSLEKIRQSKYKGSDFIGLGTYKRQSSYAKLTEKADFVAWASNINNMGMAMDRTTWTKIKNCNKQFCQFDDYNWDWTLQSLGRSCLKRPLTILTMQAPHVFHSGECSGIHHSGRCDLGEIIQKIESELSANMLYLYPSRITVSTPYKDIRRYPSVSQPKGYGGWGDIRDHKLCMSYVRND